MLRVVLTVVVLIFYAENIGKCDAIPGVGMPIKKRVSLIAQPVLYFKPFKYKLKRNGNKTKVDLIKHKNYLFTVEMTHKDRIKQYVLRNLHNVTLKPLNKKNRKIVFEDILLSPSNMQTEWTIRHVTPSFNSWGSHINTCLDDQLDGMVRVLMPDEALGRANWILLLVSFLTYSLMTSFLFGGWTRRSTYAIGTFLNSCFFYLSHLLSNPVTKRNERLSWKILFSVWLLMVDTILSKAYNSNFKGELVTVQMVYTDSAEDVLTKHNMEDVMFHPYNHSLSIEDAAFAQVMKNAKGSGAYTKTSLVIELSSKFNEMRRLWKTCKHVHQGRKKYLPITWNLALPRELPTFVKERIEYLVQRFVETRQIRPRNIWKEHTRFRVDPLEMIPQPKPTTTTFLLPIFSFWLIGITMAIIAMLLELLHQRTFQRKFN